MEKKKTPIFERIARACTQFAGSTSAFVLAISVIITWLLTGPIFDYSDTWQLVINTGTTIITFVMVFLIQRSQNKDSQAVHLKLNELVASLQGPSNRMVNVENLTEAELHQLSLYYRQLSEMAAKEKDLSVSHSIEEASENHKKKYTSKAVK
ncbi:MAG: low affinity iron permease family protein [Bacteroidota bacterium]|nr:low affinity iron permease family protein [Bacteroidota bacterium]